MNRFVFYAIIVACTTLALTSCYRPLQQANAVSLLPTQELLSYTGFTVLYNPQTRQPKMVEYTLTAEQVYATENTPDIPRHFMPDPELDLPQASSDDYKGSGWSRGHMARRQDMKWSAQAIQESDFYTNICPQHEKLNTKLWNRIEDKVRLLAKEYDSVHVVCGPIFTDTANGFIGPHRLPVPDFFFKTLLIKDSSGYHAIAFICPNGDSGIKVKDVACTVDKVEQLAKTEAYSYLPDKTEAAVESRFDLWKWRIE